MSAAGEAVSQHSCRLCSAPTQERALPGMASSDPTPMGRQGKGSSGRPWPGSWSRCATLGSPRLQLGSEEAWTWKSGGPFKGRLVQSHGKERNYDPHFPEKDFGTLGREEKTAAALGSEAQHPSPGLLTQLQLQQNLQLCTQVEGWGSGLQDQCHRARLRPGSAVHLGVGVTL